MSSDAQAEVAAPPRRGFFVNVGSLVVARGFLAVSQILVLPILARFLSVEDFALMALAMTVVIFTSVLSDAGLGRSLIRARDFDQREWSSVFWLLVGVGALLCAAILAIAPLWAWYFEEPAVVGLMAVLSVVPFCQGRFRPLSTPRSSAARNTARLRGCRSRRRLPDCSPPWRWHWWGQGSGRWWCSRSSSPRSGWAVWCGCRISGQGANSRAT